MTLDQWVMALGLTLEGVLASLLVQHADSGRNTSRQIRYFLLALAAMGVRALFFDHRTLDYINFLAYWVDIFREYGAWHALSFEIGNYNIPYLYFMALFSELPVDDLILIKLLSTLGDIFLAYGAMMICRCYAQKRAAACFFTVLMLPTVVLNSACWGQCDSLYIAPLLIGIWCALDGKPWISMIMAAIGFGFKLQAVFLLPIWAVFLMTGKIRWKHLLAFPLTYLLLVLPAICAGRPFWDTITLYFSQTGSIGDGLNYNSPSVFSIFTEIENTGRAALVGIILGVVFMLNILAVAWVRREKMEGRSFIALALMLSIGIPFLLPHMHERYFYGADILSVILAFLVPMDTPAAVLVQGASLLGYHAYLRQRYLLLMHHGAAALIVAFSLALLCFLSVNPKRSRRRVSSALLVMLPLLCLSGRASAEISVQIPEQAAAYAPGDIQITEIMVRNHSGVQDEDSEFPDWVELWNASGQDIVLDGWTLSDKERKDGMLFPAFLFPAGDRCIIFCDGKDRPETLHAPFSLSADEGIWLRDPSGSLIDSVPCQDLMPDRSLALASDGSWRECVYPTPGRENTKAAYDTLMDEWELQSPLILNEVLVSDPNGWFSAYEGSDWVELKNISGEAMNLSGWYLSDDETALTRYPLPGIVLQPGQLTVIRTDTLGLSLADDNEALFLTHRDWGLCDRLYLREIPLGGSYGRMQGRNGAWYFPQATPGEENRNGYRRISATPVALTPDGVFDEAVPLNLQADGTIHYTTSNSVPSEDSKTWTGAVNVGSTCIIRARAYEDGALPSRVLTLSYFIREGHSLPVLSLVTDNADSFWDMYHGQWKDLEQSGNVGFYAEDGSFSLPCGISLHGETSLVLRKKGMSLRFRGSYGAESLEYDLFGGGVTSFGNLLIRAGQDQTDAIIRNELCANLALMVSDNVITSRSRYVVLYINGEYSGLYALEEKMNERHYANLAGVSRDSVEVITAEVPRDTSLYRDVFLFCEQNDMSVKANYDRFCERMDVDSLIDWVFLEGYFCNSDLTYGNLRYCRSTENDGKWRFMLYDLDATLREQTKNHSILLRRQSVQCMQVSYLMSDLMKNSEFRARFLSRCSELLDALKGTMAMEEITRLKKLIEPEVARDLRPTGRSYESWENSISVLRSFFTNTDWKQHNIDAICRQLYVTDQERKKYFG